MFVDRAEIRTLILLTDFIREEGCSATEAASLSGSEARALREKIQKHAVELRHALTDLRRAVDVEVPRAEKLG